MTCRLRPLIAATAAALILAGCSSTTGGTPTASPDLGTAVSSTTATTSATTTSTPAAAPVPTQAPADVPPQYTALAQTINAIVADNAAFWAGFGPALSPSGFIVDEADDGPCRKPQAETKTPAWACSKQKVMTFNGPVMSKVQAAVPENLGMAVVIGHEAGHIALPMLDPGTNTGGDLEERRADCASGAFMRWTADGNSASIPTPSATDLATARRKMMQTSDRQAAYDHGWSSGALSCTTYQP